MLRSFGMDLIRYKPATTDSRLLAALDSIAFLREVSTAGGSEDELRFVDFCARHWRISKSQLFQDLFVQYELKEKMGGFFVEFGAADGVHLSNSYSLEKEFKWNGILSEPARSWQDALRVNRVCKLDLRCIWDVTGQNIEFSEVEAAELSTIKEFSESDLHAQTRRLSHVYRVNTVTLNDMLEQADAPSDIDYMSIDTEGSEFKILSAFDFGKYDVKVITVEHNYTPQREKIQDLLTKNGFRRKFENFSRFDDWYVRT